MPTLPLLIPALVGDPGGSATRLFDDGIDSHSWSGKASHRLGDLRATFLRT
jgi:hypothetical protein